MESFKLIISIAFFAFYGLVIFSFIQKNSSFKKTIFILFSLLWIYIFFLITYFLNKGNLSFNRYSEVYLFLVFLLLVFFLLQEIFISKKPMALFYFPFIIYISLLGFYFLKQETEALSFNLTTKIFFNYVIESFFLLGVVGFFYVLMLSILYRYLLLEYQFKKGNFLKNRVPSLDVISNLIDFNLLFSSFFFLLKIIFLSYFFSQQKYFITEASTLLHYLGIIFIFAFFMIIIFFRLKSWLHSKSNLRWIYLGNGLLVIYFLFLY